MVCVSSRDGRERENMIKTDQDSVTVSNGSIEAGINTFGSLQAIHGASGAKEILTQTFGSYSVANLLQVAWQERRTLARTIEMLEAHFEHF